MPDGQVTVLRATDAASGETIATYATIPVHPALMPGVAFDPPVLSADYPGAVRVELDRLLGGIRVVAPGTLGRQTSPWSRRPRRRRRAGRIGRSTGSRRGGTHRPRRATDARPVRDDRIASTEAMEDDAGPQRRRARAGGREQRRQRVLRGRDGGRGAVAAEPRRVAAVAGRRAAADAAHRGPDRRAAVREPAGRAVRRDPPRAARRRARRRPGRRDLAGPGRARLLLPGTVAPLALAYPVNDHALFNVAPTFGDAIVARDVALAGELGFEATTGPRRSRRPEPLRALRDLGDPVPRLAAPRRGLRRQVRADVPGDLLAARPPGLRRERPDARRRQRPLGLRRRDDRGHRLPVQGLARRRWPPARRRVACPPRVPARALHGHGPRATRRAARPRGRCRSSYIPSCG